MSDLKTDIKKKKSQNNSSSSSSNNKERPTSNKPQPIDIFNTEKGLQMQLHQQSLVLVQTKQQLESVMNENQLLKEKLERMSNDSKDILEALKRSESLANQEKEEIQSELQNQKSQHQQTIQELESKHIQQIDTLTQEISQLKTELLKLQSEREEEKEYLSKRHELLKAITTQKSILSQKEHEYEERYIKAEQKFTTQKLLIEQESEKRIKHLALQAHQLAILNLDKTTKEIYMENLRMNEIQIGNIEEISLLKKRNLELEGENEKLKGERGIHDLIIKEKIVGGRQQAQQIRELHLKITNLEKLLTQIVHEFEKERLVIGQVAKRELELLKQECIGLKESLNKKTIETKYIKKLAQHILGQRGDLEKFFMDALEQTRIEIRKQEKLKKKHITSTSNSNTSNSTTIDLEKYEGGQIQMEELSWKDKEKVLRLLFAKMNGLTL